MLYLETKVHLHQGRICLLQVTELWKLTAYPRLSTWTMLRAPHYFTNFKPFVFGMFFAMAGSRRDGLEDSKDDSQWCYAAGTMWTAFREDYKGKRVEKQCALMWLEPAWEEQSSCCTTCGASPVQILKLSLFEYLQSALLGKKVICAAGSALQFLV